MCSIYFETKIEKANPPTKGQTFVQLFIEKKMRQWMLKNSDKTILLTFKLISQTFKLNKLPNQHTLPKK